MLKAMKPTIKYQVDGGSPGPGNGTICVTELTHMGLEMHPTARVTIGLSVHRVCVLIEVGMPKQKVARRLLVARQTDEDKLDQPCWVSPSRVTMVDAGDASKEEITRITRDYFGGKKFPPMPREVTLLAGPPSLNRSKSHVSGHSNGRGSPGAD
jgi:hypothetical protein